MSDNNYVVTFVTYIILANIKIARKSYIDKNLTWL